MKYLLMITGFVLVSIQLQAQVSNPKDIIKQQSTDRANTHISDGVNAGLNKAEGAIKGLFGKKKKKSHDKTASDVDLKDGSAKNMAATAGATASISTYQNYDFVPGDTILFADNFAEDQNGEFPAHWNLQKGQAVVNAVGGRPSFCITQGNYCEVSPRMKTGAYLGGAFTIEFDTYCDNDNSEQGSPILYLDYTDKEGNSQNGEIQFNKGDLEGRGDVSLSNFPHGLSSDMPEKLRESYPDNWHHCAIIFKNNQLKCYVDQYRILTVPGLDCVPTDFGFEGVGNQVHPIVITNIRLASGGEMNLIGKKFTDAKIVTHGITFAVDKSDLKPESMGTLNMIVHILNNNPPLKFEIDGHTDNTGAAAHNLSLSEQRANAVKDQLIKMGISADRLSTKGLGDTKPISDNDTPEGRANNRRVEFVRM